MNTVMLAVVPVRDAVLPAGALETIGECEGRAILVGSGLDEAAARLHGAARRVLLAECSEVEPSVWARGIAALIAAVSPMGVVLPASPDGRDLAPRLAAELDRPLFAGATEVTATRVTTARYGGRSLVDQLPRAPFVATLLPGMRGVTPIDAELEIERRPLASDRLARPVRSIEVLPPEVATMDLAEAPAIVGAGAGLLRGAHPENTLAELARVGEALGCSLGATRVVTDAGLLGHDRQIGTTGVVVDPRLYVAFGVSGAVQHTSGLGHPEHVISVNTDPHCPMMAIADLAVVADAAEVIAALARAVGVSAPESSVQEAHP